MTASAHQTATLTFDHVGIVVVDLASGRRRLAAMLGPLDWTQNFDDAGLGVSVCFARDRSGVVYELIAPFGEASPVARTLASKANLLNQIAYRVVALEPAVAALRRGGAAPVGAARPAQAFGGARVQFLFSPLGFLIELIEAPDHVHWFEAEKPPSGT